MGFFGLALVIVGIALFVTSFNAARKLDRAAFERTNSAGVQEFASYDEALSNRLRTKRTGFAYAAGGLLIIAGALIAAAGFAGQSENDRARTLEQRQAGRAEALRQCEAGDGEACGLETYYRGCLENRQDDQCRYADQLQARRDREARG